MHEVSSKNTTRCWKLCFTSVWVKVFLFSKLERYFAKKCVLHQMCSKNTTRCWKLCLTSFCVKNYLSPNYKHVLPKNAFCMKSAQRIQLAVGKGVWHLYVLKTTFCQILRMSCKKMRFAWNLLKEYNSLLKTVSLHVVLKTTLCRNLTMSC